MPSFEEDAFARAQQMHRRNPQQNKTQPQQQAPRQNRSTEPPQAPPEPVIQESKPEPVQTDIPLNALFKDKEQSLILLLIIVLMEENSNPSLLLALIYLLI